jgi:hypothetical protein
MRRRRHQTPSRLDRAIPGLVLAAILVSGGLWLDHTRSQRAAIEQESLSRVSRGLCTEPIGSSAERLVVAMEDRNVWVSREHWKLMAAPTREEFAMWASVCRMDAGPVSIRLAGDRNLVATYSRSAGYRDVF